MKGWMWFNKEWNSHHKSSSIVNTVSLDVMHIYGVVILLRRFPLNSAFCGQVQKIFPPFSCNHKLLWGVKFFWASVQMGGPRWFVGQEGIWSVSSRLLSLPWPHTCVNTPCANVCVQTHVCIIQNAPHDVQPLQPLLPQLFVKGVIRVEVSSPFPK